MKKLFVILTAIVIATPFAQAEAKTTGFLEFTVPTRGIEQGQVILSGLLDLKVHKHVSLTGFMMVTKGWAQGYFGPSFTPTNWMQIGFGVGFSQGAKDLSMRLAASLLFYHKFFLFIGIFETDHQLFVGSTKAFWYDLEMKFTVLPWLAIGLKDRRSVGAGVFTEFRYWKLSLKIAWMPLPAESKQIFDPSKDFKFDALRFLAILKLSFR